MTTTESQRQSDIGFSFDVIAKRKIGPRGPRKPKDSKDSKSRDEGSRRGSRGKYRATPEPQLRWTGKRESRFKPIHGFLGGEPTPERQPTPVSDIERLLGSKSADRWRRLPHEKMMEAMIAVAEEVESKEKSRGRSNANDSLASLAAIRVFKTEDSIDG